MQVHVQVVPKNLVPEIIIAIEMDSVDFAAESEFFVKIPPTRRTHLPSHTVKVREDVRVWSVEF